MWMMIFPVQCDSGEQLAQVFFNPLVSAPPSFRDFVCAGLVELRTVLGLDLKHAHSWI